MPTIFYLYLVLILIANIVIILLVKRTGKKEQEHPTGAKTTEKLRYEALLNNIGEGLVVTDKSGQITTFNRAAELLLGWKEHETLGKSLHDVLTIGYNRSQELGSQPSLYFVRKDKTSFPVALSATSYIQDKEVLGTITLFRDITTEQNIDKMKNEFISLASHQLRTPLAAIKWNIEMLINGDGGKLLPEQMEYADSVYSSTKRMIDLVNALLNVSRIESGRIIVEPTPTEIQKLVEEVLEEVKIRFAEKQQKMNLTTQGTLPLINLDPRLIRQAYVNFLTNAAKYTPEKGEITITISQKDNDILSEIRDNGYGIPEKEQKKVFDKFYRGENIVSKGTDGTGLGLYLIKTIIELSQGKVWYKSQEGKGTTFWFTLPIAGTPPRKGVVSLDN
jgi:PAS domain S-box-containing protein